MPGCTAIKLFYGADYIPKNHGGQIMKTPLLSYPTLESYQTEIRALAQQAGALIMEYYAREIDTQTKQDGSPVTLADQAAETLITRGLTKMAPDIPVIGEEAMAAAPDIMPIAPDCPCFWLVDALDGTREFIKKNGEFTVNIALIADGIPILGVIYAPALAEEYFGLVGAKAFGVTRTTPIQPLACRGGLPSDGADIVASRSHATPAQLEIFLADTPVRSLSSRGSSLKFCDVAAGRADLYPRFGPTCEWDTAAGQAILLAAGGSMTKLDGTAFDYGKTHTKFLNGGFVASGLSPQNHQIFIEKSKG